MTARRRLLLAIMGLSAITLAALLRPLREEQAFHRPGPAEARAAQALFRAALADPEGGVSGSGLAALGLEERQWRHEETDRGLVLEEPDGQCTGQGAYLLRSTGLQPTVSPIPVLLSAPHRGADRYTGTIAHRLFRDHPFAAAAWNSAPRKAGQTCPSGGDLAREPHHAFTAFALAFAAHYPAGRIVQLHGFDPARRADGRAQEADIIVSDGSNRPGAMILDLADCLTRGLPGWNVALYPIDTAELGGTSNAQGQAVRAAGFGGFAHLELGLELRQALAADQDLRSQFARCLEAGPA